MKKLKKIFIVIGIIILILLGGYVYVNYTYRVDYNAKYPAPNIKVTADSNMIKRGEYLVYGPSHCPACHVPMEQAEAFKGEVKMDMIGGYKFDIPVIGTIYSRNLTPDLETGIGNVSDGQLYRMMRHNVLPDGTTTLPFMPFEGMSDYDIRSIIAYLRSRPAKHHPVPENKLAFGGKLIYKYMFAPYEPKDPPADVKKDTTAQYGKYLVYSASDCRGCHTQRDQTGAYVGTDFAGGLTFEPSVETKGWTFVTPNLTPDPKTGRITNWTEEQFIKRFRSGKIYPTSPMPWNYLKNMDDTDLKAIYRYLMSL